ncbi:MAG TPA: transcriptional repressor [Spirochaetota bacterium]|nr:transcriptional repressor [Spirochaetota bacterium]
MPPRRKSRQRERIYELISASMEHPTAQRLFETLKKEMPSASLGNVYRNINILVEEGRVQCRMFGDGVEHYDAITGSHYHFICERCRTVTDFTMPLQEEITAKARTMTGNTITGHTIQFFGICDACVKKTNKGRKQ